MRSSIRSFAFAGAALTGLALTACGSSDRQTPTLDLPLTAPDGTDGVLADFIDICSLSLVDQPAAIEQLSEREWSVPGGSSMEQVAAFGGHFSENAEGYTIQFVPVDYPHLKGTNCFVVGMPEGELPDLSPLQDIDGLQGTLQSSGFGGDDNQLGRFSGIAPSGYPVTIQAIKTNNRFINLIMTTTRPVKPTDTTQE